MVVCLDGNEYFFIDTYQMMSNWFDGLLANILALI